MYKLIIEYTNLENNSYRIETITNKDTIIGEMALLIANKREFDLITDKSTGLDNLVYINQIRNSANDTIEIKKTFVVNLI